jgi:hypothetical protein
VKAAPVALPEIDGDDEVKGVADSPGVVVPEEVRSPFAPEADYAFGIYDEYR